MLSRMPVVVVSGPEAFLAERAVDEAISAARQANPAVEVTEVDAANLDHGTFLELVSPSLFGEARVLVLRQAATPAGCQDAIIEYVGAPDPDVTLIIIHDGGQRGRKIVDAARAAGATVVDCGKLTRFEERLDFVRNEVRRAGGRIEAAGARALLDAVGSDLRDLAAAAGQLVLDADGPVDAETVRRYHSGRADAKGWAVADRAMEGRGAAAMEELRWVLALGTEPVLVIGSLAAGIRNVAAVASRQRDSDAAIAKDVGMPAWKVRSVRSQARGWTAEGVAAALQAVADADVEVKGGGAHASYALERAVRRIVEARAS
jgi:DNA polymerase-3 subunit delta